MATLTEPVVYVNNVPQNATSPHFYIGRNGGAVLTLTTPQSGGGGGGGGSPAGAGSMKMGM